MDELLPGMASAPLHPMFVHFPTALWFAAVPVWLYAVVKKSTHRNLMLTDHALT